MYVHFGLRIYNIISTIFNYKKILSPAKNLSWETFVAEEACATLPIGVSESHLKHLYHVDLQDHR